MRKGESFERPGEAVRETVIALGRSTPTYGIGGAMVSVERSTKTNRIVAYWVRWGQRPDGVFAGGGQRYAGKGARTRAAECFHGVTEKTR